MPGGYGTGDIIGSGYQERPPRRGSRILTYVVVAALAAGVGAGTVLALKHNNTTPASVSLPGSGAIPQPGSGSAGSTNANSATTQAVASKVSPGIVDVISTPSYSAAGGQLEGTGMILSRSGLVLTNNHVVEGTSHVTAKIANTGQTYSVTVLGTDDVDDVALLQLNGAANLKTVPLGNSNGVQVGAPVVALGNAEGEDGAPTIVTGKVTHLNQSINATDAGAGTTENLHGMLETNAPIVPGDSGGALANTQGQVIGMNTAAQTAANAGGTGTSQGFAIPINRALSIASQIAGGHATSDIQIGLPAFLGVTVASAKSGPSTSTSPATQLQQLRQNANQSGFGSFGGGTGSSSGACLSTDTPSVPSSYAHVSSGALIGGVLCETPADSAGMTGGTVITSIDGQAVSSPAALTKVLTKYHPGNTISVTWTATSGQQHTSSLKLTSGPAK
jgi:S1-C subfamily serine protease